MPLYEYQCEACGHRFEVIQKFSDAPVETCPKYGGAVRKLQSSPAFQFKGSGWYVTDYARKDTKETKDGAKDAKAESKDTPAASTDAKSDAKETKPTTETKSKETKPSDSSRSSSE